MSTFKVKVMGERELIRTLEAMPKAVRRRVARQALGPAAKAMSNAIKQRAPETLIRKSIGQRPKTYSNSGTAVRIVGVKYNFIGSPSDLKKDITTRDEEGKIVTAAVRARIYEYGNEDTPPAPFIRPAFDATVNQAKALISSELRRAVDAAAARGGGGT